MVKNNKKPAANPPTLTIVKNPFVPAIREKTFLKLLLMGASGTGKTWTALEMAQRIAGEDGKIAVIDSEGGASKLYAGRFNFDVFELTDHNPDNYIALINAAAEYGYAVVIVDSWSHAWNNKGGVLDIVDKAGQGWRVGKPAYNRMIAGILAAKVHIIGTARAQVEFAPGEDFKAIGIKPSQHKEFEAEANISFFTESPGEMTVRKSRCPELPMHTRIDGANIDAICELLTTWAGAGEKPQHWSTYPHQQERMIKWQQESIAKRGKPITEKIIAAVARPETFTTPEAYGAALNAEARKPGYLETRSSGAMTLADSPVLPVKELKSAFKFIRPDYAEYEFVPSRLTASKMITGYTDLIDAQVMMLTEIANKLYKYTKPDIENILGKPAADLLRGGTGLETVWGMIKSAYQESKKETETDGKTNKTSKPKTASA